MASYKYNHELLAPYLTLDQGDKIQAECLQLSVFLSVRLTKYNP